MRGRGVEEDTIGWEWEEGRGNFCACLVVFTNETIKKGWVSGICCRTSGFSCTEVLFHVQYTGHDRCHLNARSLHESTLARIQVCCVYLDHGLACGRLHGFSDKISFIQFLDQSFLQQL